jgi:HEAT repeat protein
MKRLIAVVLATWSGFAASRGLAGQHEPLPIPLVASGILFSPDNRLVLVEYLRSENEREHYFRRILDARTGKQLYELPETRDQAIGTTAFLPDNCLLIAPTNPDAGEAGGLSLLDSSTGRQVGRLPCPEPHNTSAVAVSPDGKLALTGHAEGHLNLWDLPDRKLIRTLGEPQPLSSKNCVHQLRFAGGGRWFLAHSTHKLRLWRVQTSYRIPSWSKEVLCFPCGLSPDGKLAASPWEKRAEGDIPVHVWGGPIRVWELATGKVVLELKGHEAPMTAATFTPNGRGLLSAGEHTIKRWDLRTGELLWSLTFAPPSTQRTASVAFSADGRLAITATGETVKLWDLTTRKLLRLLAAPPHGTKDDLLLKLLTDRARDRDPAVRREAVEDLGKVGRASIPLLIKALRDEWAEVRVEAGRGLGRCGPYDPATAEPALRHALKDGDGFVRVEAALSLHAIRSDAATRGVRGVIYPNKQSIPPLRRELKNPDHRVRLRAVEILGEISADALGGLADPELCMALKDARADVRRKAASLLNGNRMLAGERLPALVAALQDPDGAVRVLAASALEYVILFIDRGPWPPPGFPTHEVAVGLAGAVREKDRDVRRRATHLLWKLGPHAQPAAAGLTAAVEDADALVRAHAAAALVRIDPKTPAAKVLIEALDDRAARGFAVTAVCDLGPHAGPAVPALLRVLSDDRDHRVAAFQSLAQLGEVAVPDMVRALETWTESPLAVWLAWGREGARPVLWAPLGADRHPRECVAFTLGRMHTVRRLGPGLKTVVPVLARLAADPKQLPGLRSSCLNALGHIGPDARAAVPALVRILQETDPVRREVAAHALWRIDPAAAHKAGAPRSHVPGGKEP